jgi:hypothetical protein
VIGPWNEAGDRAGNEDAPLIARPHLASDALNEIDRPGDVGVDDVPDVIEVLIEKRSAQSVASIGQECVHGPAADHRPEALDTLPRRQVHLDGLDIDVAAAQFVSSLMNVRLVGGHNQIEILFGANPGELEADAR